MSSLPQLKTNKHTFRRKANPNWVSQKLITGNTATFRVKFTLTKLQEDVWKNGAETNYSDSENHINSQKKTQLFTIQTHRGQENRKPKAEQKHSKLKHLGSRLTAHFIKFSENFYFLLKGWACPSSISHPSSRISRLKKKQNVMSHPNSNSQTMSH